MAIYDGFDESLFRDLDSSTQESLEDVGLDHEERDKIQYEAQKSLKVSPRVDYSKFENHVFFGSAYWAINFALSRIFDEENGYPWSGELKEKNEWESLNSDFENWWFKNEYPHEFGYASFAGFPYISVNDLEKKLQPGTGSFTIEAVIKPDIDTWVGTLVDKPIFSYIDSTNQNGIAVSLSSSSKWLNFSIHSASTINKITASYHPYASSSHHVAFRYNAGNKEMSILVDGTKLTGSTFSTLTNINISVNSGSIGFRLSAASPLRYSGSIDDFRFWGSARSDELIKRNYYKSIHANHSGNLLLYYKFNELENVSPVTTVIDYSGNDLHGTWVDSYTSNNKVSGTLGSWFKTKGDPVFNRTNTRVSASLSKWFSSGSNYDRDNQNLIFNLVPSFFIEENDHDEMRLFLLLIARHYDRLKLYIQHLANYLYSNEEKYENVPDELLNILAQNYGLDIAGVYDSGKPLEQLFGETILSTGSLDVSLQTVRNQLRRNLVNNLVYILKTKSTQESIRTVFRTLGLDEDVVNINEYSAFSGGIGTSYTNKTVERRVARFGTGSNVYLNSLCYSLTKPRSYQVRTLFNTSSVHLTSSILTIQSSSGQPVFYLRSERENLTSSYGTAKLYASGSVTPVLSSSLAKLYDNEWVNFTAYFGSTGQNYGLHVSRFFRDEIDFHFSASGTYTAPTNLTEQVLYLGSSGSDKFEGWMQEFRNWGKALSSSATIDKHTYDFDSLVLDDFLTELDGQDDTVIGTLRSHLKLNDHTGSGAIAHDYSGFSLTGTFIGFSSSSDYNFPGRYIYKSEQSYAYDININNDKIRLHDKTSLEKNEVTEDIPYLSVDISPIVSLNKEIVKWFGDIEKFNDIIGRPYNKYRTEISELNPYSSKFFERRVDSRIKIDSYFSLLKWFDLNFSYFIRQIIPLDLVSTVSNFVIEPHLFEYNKVTYEFPYKKGGQSRSIVGIITATPAFSASDMGLDIDFADPGRFGAAVSASGELHAGALFNYTALTSSGLNYSKLSERKVLTDYLQMSESAASGYGNGFYSLVITGSQYLKNALNVIEEFQISEIRYDDDDLKSDYLSSSQGAPENTFYTGSFPAWQDQRWLWYHHTASGLDSVNQLVYDKANPTWDFGIKYGAGAGQLIYFVGKSQKTSPWSPYLTPTSLPTVGVGYNTTVNRGLILPWVEVSEKIGNRKVVYLWPTAHSFDGAVIGPGPLGESLTGSFADGSQAAKFGDVVEIEGYKSLLLTIEMQLISKVLGQASNVGAKVKFQFFNDTAGGAIAFEGALTGSMNTTTNIWTTKTIEHEYAWDKDIGTGALSEGLVFSLERNLPQTKYMRIFLTISSTSSANDKGYYRVLVKGTLSPEESINKSIVGELK